MTIADKYPTGTDYTLYISDGTAPAATGVSNAPDGVTPDFEQMQELDVKNFTYMEDGEVTPLYHANFRTPDHFAYSRKLVNGSMQFHFSEQFQARWRNGSLQSIQGKTLWIVCRYTDWRPLRHVEDIYRISEVYEHPFRHEPQPTAMEQVPISGRDLTLIERRTADLDADVFADLARETDSTKIRASDLFRERQSRHLATVQNVEDGDTLTCRIDATGQPVTVRLAGADTPEKPGASKRQPVTDWTWPSGADPHPDGPEYGKDNEAPSVPQLDEWGLFVREQLRNWLPVGSKVWLVTDQGTAPKGTFGRYIFRVDAPTPFPVPDPLEGDVEPHHTLGRHLVRMGYAIPYNSDSIALNAENTYINLSDLMDEDLATARDRAGSEQAAGIWRTFDVDTWKEEAGL